MTSSSPEPGGPLPLSGTLALDLTTSVAGQYAGRMLAMHGATVLLVEGPGGTPTRALPPLGPGDAGSYLFRHLNQGKGSVVVDPADAGDGEVLADLVRRADVVLRDQGSALPHEPPGSAIDCEIGDFPAGPYQDWQGGELVQQALSGVMNATGLADRPPIYGVGQRASYATGTTAYISVLCALHERRRSGSGQRVSATVFESAAAMGQNLVSQFSYNGTAESRAKYPGFLSILRCRDAWVVLFAIRNWPALCRVFGHEDLLDDPRFATSGGRLAHWELITEMLAERARDMDADDVVAACQQGRVSAEKVGTLGELTESEQWKARAVLSEVDSADGSRRESALRRLFVMAGADVGVAEPSPLPGEPASAAVAESLR